jgi:hypothetical protein
LVPKRGLELEEIKHHASKNSVNSLIIKNKYSKLIYTRKIENIYFFNPLKRKLIDYSRSLTVFKFDKLQIFQNFKPAFCFVEFFNLRPN